MGDDAFMLQTCHSFSQCDSSQCLFIYIITKNEEKRVLIFKSVTFIYFLHFKKLWESCILTVAISITLFLPVTLLNALKYVANVVFKHSSIWD